MTPHENADVDDDAGAHPMSSRLGAEAVGAFALVFIEGVGAVLAAREGLSESARALAKGGLIMAMSLAMASTSGAHFNPAVTFAFALRGVFPWRQVPLYVAAQIAGAIAASLLVVLWFGRTAAAATQTHADVDSVWIALSFEIVLTFFLVVVTLSTATRHRVIGPTAPIAAGATLALCTLIGRPISGGSMNPARSLAPALVTVDARDLWLYIVGPLIGAVVGWIVTSLVHPHHHREELVAARGQ